MRNRELARAFDLPPFIADAVTGEPKPIAQATRADLLAHVAALQRQAARAVTWAAEGRALAARMDVEGEDALQREAQEWAAREPKS